MKRFILCLLILLAASILGCLWYSYGGKQAAQSPVNETVAKADTAPANTTLPLELREMTIDSPHWKGAPIKIGLLANIDVGSPRSQPPQLDKIVGRLNVEQPDIILLAGDYVHGVAPQSERSKTDNDTINWGHAILGDLNAPLGVFAVLGDHDHQYGADIVRANMEKQGANFLDNNASVIDNRLCVFGIADETLGGPNDNGYYNCPVNFPIIGLMHNPESSSRVPDGVSLLVAGRGAYGLKVAGSTTTLTTSGISAASGAPIAPEIVLIELRAAAK